MSPYSRSRTPNSSPGNPLPAETASQRIARSLRFRRRVRQGLIGSLLLSIATFCLANLAASWQLHHELAAVVHRGEPLRLSALAPPQIPEAQNAALVYLRAASELHVLPAEEEKLSSKREITIDTDLLAKNRTAIRLTRQAAELPACRFPIDYEATNLAGILLPHLAKMRHLGEIVRAQALWEAQQGQTDAALNDIAVLFRMSEHIAPEPILISGLVAMSLERTGYRTLADVLQKTSLSPEQAHAFASRFSHTDWTATMRRDLQGDRCFGLWAFQYVSNPIQAGQLQGNPTTRTSNPLSKVLSVLWSPLWKMDEVYYLRILDQRSEEFRHPGTPLVSDDVLMQDIPLYAICTRVMLPTFPRVAQKRDEVLVYRRMATVALAIHAYHTTEGRYPTDLSAAETAWGQTLPHDLYTDQPFPYKTEGETLSLYSVGPNRKDEGGHRSARADEADQNSAKTDPTPEEDDLAWQETGKLILRRSQ